MTNVNRSALTKARGLINGGKINRTAPWSFSSSDGNKLLGGTPGGDNNDDLDWARYGSAHLGRNADADETTKDGWRYPYGKLVGGGIVVFRSALRAIASRGAQAGDSAISDAASALIELDDNNESSDDIDWDTGTLTFDADIELKKADDAGEGVFEGMASTFGNTDLVGDVIRRGAFRETLKAKPTSKIKMLWQHDTTEPIGKWLSMKETRSGLYVKGQLLIEDDAVPLARKAYSLMKAGVLDAMSIGFRVPENGAEFDDKRRLRILKEIDLMEVSVVTFPANPKAEIDAVKRILEEGGFPTERQFEHWLTRDAGFSALEAKAIVSRGFRHLLTTRDAGEGDHDEATQYMQQLRSKLRAA